MVCTGSEDPPASESIRCLPEMWTTPTKRKPIKLWDDTGAGGGRPGSAWIVNDLNMIAIVAGECACVPRLACHVIIAASFKSLCVRYAMALWCGARYGRQCSSYRMLFVIY